MTCDSYYGESDIDYRLARQRATRAALGEDYFDPDEAEEAAEAEEWRELGGSDLISEEELAP